MIYWDVFWTFVYIGSIGFGGGYAFLPLIQGEMAARGYLTPLEFGNIVAVAEMTPGPIAINTATFVGAKMGGLLGSLLATLGVVLPSLLLILLAAHWIVKYRRHPRLQGVFQGLRPVVTALIATAGVFLLQTNFAEIESLSLVQFLTHRDVIVTLGVALVTGILLKWTKLHPIFLILGAAVFGFLASYGF